MGAGFSSGLAMGELFAQLRAPAAPALGGGGGGGGTAAAAAALPPIPVYREIALRPGGGGGGLLNFFDLHTLLLAALIGLVCLVLGFVMHDAAIKALAEEEREKERKRGREHDRFRHG